jgi:hypothetical protein
MKPAASITAEKSNLELIFPFIGIPPFSIEILSLGCLWTIGSFFYQMIENTKKTGSQAGFAVCSPKILPVLRSNHL